ncbi:MAG: aspartate aminotransferase family protein [Clostridia bacterium]|nr:aspartate aminotransferase family protein [Clostridia bacterium]
MSIIATDKTYIAGTYGRFPVELVRGEGSVLYSADNKRYIDMGTGIAVNTFGISDPVWTDAVTAQLTRLQHTSNLYYTEPCALLAKELCERSGMKKVFFGNSGAEANECAIKVARKWGEENKGEDYYTVITLRNSFHGRTITTLSATGQDHYHRHFGPMTPGFVYAETENLDEVRSLAKNHKCCAIMFECVQGEGGVIPLSAEFVHGLKAIAEEYDLLLIVDEVQTGNGRCGQFYCYMNYGIKPDVVSTAKGLGGGLPIGAVLLGEKVENTLRPGDHGSTFGGNPVCAAGALNVIRRLDDTTLRGVRERSDYIKEKLIGKSGIKSISGMGLMIGIETVKPAREIVAACLERGVLCLTAKDKVRLLPALNIPMDILDEALNVIIDVCAE